MGTTLNNLGACASNLLTGKKYGGVLVNGKLTLVPSQRLTQFVDNAAKQGFGFDTSHPLTGSKAGEYARRLASAGKNAKINTGNMHVYSQAHGWTQISEITAGGKEKPVIDVVEKLKSPTRNFIRNIGTRIKTSTKTVGKKFATIGKKAGAKIATMFKSAGSWLKSILPKIKAFIK